MTSYIERYTEVVLNSNIAVMVLLNQDNTDMEFWRLKPCQAAESELTTRAEFAARKLRPVGVAGLQGTTPAVALKEPLDPAVVGAIGTAFAEYIRALIGDSVAMQIEERQKGDEVSWLDRLHQLPDARVN